MAVAAFAVGAWMPAASAAADTTPPVLRSLSLSPAALTPGGALTATVDATDDVAVDRVVVSVGEVSSGRYQAVESFRGGNQSVFSAPVTASWANGTYRVRYVMLFDAAGNYSLYRPDGSYTASPTPPKTAHEVDLTSQQVSVSGASDLSPPVLSAFTMTAAAGRAQAPSSFSFTVADGEAGVASIQTLWTGLDSGLSVVGGSLASPPRTGSMTALLPQAGRWSLASVQVADTHGNQANYQADGIISRSGLPGKHDLHLDTIGLTLAPGPQSITVLPRPGRLTIVRAGTPGDATLLSGLRLTLQPAGITKDLTASDGSQVFDIAGLPNGVSQAVTLTARSAWGDSLPSRQSGRPQLSSNVVGLPDITGDGRADVVAQRQYLVSSDARVQVYAGTGRGGLRAATVFRTGNWDHCQSLGAYSYRYWGEGRPLCRTDRLAAMDRTFDEELGARGWASMRFVDGGFDLNGDRTGDVIAVDPSGVLRLYAQTTRGRLVAWPRIGTGWSSMISVISAGDLNGDRRNDIVAADAAGRLWLYPGNGKGGVTTRRQIGSGWHRMGALVPLRDFDGDGRADLGGITTGGDLRLYRGTGTGGVRSGVVIGTGWQRYL